MGLYIIVICLIVCLINLLHGILNVVDFGFDALTTIWLIVQIGTTITCSLCLYNYLN